MARSFCSVDGCDQPSKSRGLCNRHYQRWWNHGDPTAIFSNKGMPTEERFSVKTMALPNGCVVWTGTKNPKGYGMFTDEAGRAVSAHRWAYRHFVGPVPDGMSIDHTCHNMDLSCPGGNTCLHRSCVNPAHLEPVTNRENQRRSPADPARKTHCPQGHPYSGENLIIRARGGRACRHCLRFAQRRYSERKRLEAGRSR